MGKLEFAEFCKKEAAKVAAHALMDYNFVKAYKAKRKARDASPDRKASSPVRKASPTRKTKGKTKTERNPNKPKKNIGPFFAFSADDSIKEKARSKFPEEVTKGGIKLALSSLWKTLSEGEKQVWKDKVAPQEELYRIQMKEFKEHGKYTTMELPNKAKSSAKKQKKEKSAPAPAPVPVPVQEPEFSFSESDSD